MRREADAECMVALLSSVKSLGDDEDRREQRVVVSKVGGIESRKDGWLCRGFS